MMHYVFREFYDFIVKIYILSLTHTILSRIWPHKNFFWRKIILWGKFKNFLWKKYICLFSTPLKISIFSICLPLFWGGSKRKRKQKKIIFFFTESFLFSPGLNFYRYIFSKISNGVAFCKYSYIFFFFCLMQSPFFFYPLFFLSDNLMDVFLRIF